VLLPLDFRTALRSMMSVKPPPERRDTPPPKLPSQRSPMRVSRIDVTKAFTIPVVLLGLKRMKRTPSKHAAPAVGPYPQIAIARRRDSDARESVISLRIFRARVKSVAGTV
jgi:hypothetical protein